MPRRLRSARDSKKKDCTDGARTMNTWENFAAFGDIAELEHVCGLVADNVASAANGGDLADLTEENSYLRRQLERQDSASRKLIEEERPDLYARTWMASLFYDIQHQLDDMGKSPTTASAELPGLVLRLHKVLIAGYDVFDPYRRKLLVEAAQEAGASRAKAEQSAKAKAAVKARGDQVMKKSFLSWASAAIAAGNSASNVNELQALDGFECKWSQKAPATLKGWAKEAGFTFTTGRPKKEQQ